MIVDYFTRKQKRMTKDHITGTLPSTKITPDSEELWTDPPAKGILIVFHGTPLSQYIKAANEAGKALNLPVRDIDWLIVDCLVHNVSPAAQEVNNIINQAFDGAEEDPTLESYVSEGKTYHN